MGVKERLLLDRVTLGSGSVSPGDVERAAAIVADFADAGLAFGDGAAVAAGEAAHAVVLKLLVKTGISLADSFVENTAEGGGHESLYFYSNAVEDGKWAGLPFQKNPHNPYCRENQSVKQEQEPEMMCHRLRIECGVDDKAIVL
jgi:hypothetical protein